MNEGKYLELCNDMKRQYDNIKKEHIKEIAKKNKIIAEKEELIIHLKSLLQSQPHKKGQFESIRPSADIARYTNVMGMMSSFD